MAEAPHSKQHPYHLVNPSPWPFAGAMSALLLGIGAVLSMHGHGSWVLWLGVALLVLTATGWWRDVLRESNERGLHTLQVQRGLRMGMGLFIASEVMFFFAMFWAYFHSSLMPTEATGGVWPPKGIETIDPLDLPYLNTLLLLLSGTTVTWAHHALFENNRRDLARGLLCSFALGLVFSAVQAFEYMHATFKLADGIYPSTFYMTTGFHGFHVLVGTIFLIVCWRQARSGRLTIQQHVGFESAAWYWHFVDVVWLFLFVSIYWWGYRPGT